MACKYPDGTDIKIGDTVRYETIDYEPGRSYGISRVMRTGKVREIKVIMDNGDQERPSSLMKVSSGPSAAGPAGAGAERGGRRRTRKTRKNTRKH
jgi:hypothetical protein